MQLQKIIENHWYHKINPILSLLLLPLSLVFFLISSSRRFMYKAGILPSHKLPVPIVIIGNISVGGTGKTPLTKHLAAELTKLGISVGVILRGYKSQNKDAMVVNTTDDSELVGDEALIYANNGTRVAIGRNRYLAGLTLLKQHPDIQLILADDGMQHYKLQRDFEVAVIDSTRMLGNRFVLPMGPLRETSSRLQLVNAIVVNGTIPNSIKHNLKLPPLIIEQNIVLDKIYNPKLKATISIENLNQHKVTAIAAIGNPQRFFNFLISLGLKINNNISFPDHHHYIEHDLPKNSEVILVTEKDYAKLSKFNLSNIWVVMVKAELNNPQLIKQLQQLAAI